MVLEYVLADMTHHKGWTLPRHAWWGGGAQTVGLASKLLDVTSATGRGVGQLGIEKHFSIVNYVKINQGRQNFFIRSVNITEAQKSSNKLLLIL